jgi:hypothetical protein
MNEVKTATYQVLIENWYTTKVKLDKLVAKAGKLGLAPITYTVGEKKV